MTDSTTGTPIVMPVSPYNGGYNGGGFGFGDMGSGW